MKCHYISLSGTDIHKPLARELGLAQTSDWSLLMERLSESFDGRRRLFLIDEADLFVQVETTRNYSMLNQFRNLSEQGTCQFILSGFWTLYYVATFDSKSPIQNFGEILTIGALEEDASRQLATIPMRSVNIQYKSDRMIDRILYETGRRANLIAIVCDTIVKTMYLKERVIEEDHLESALDSDAVRDALAGWGMLGGHDERVNRLDRILVYLTIEGEMFSLDELFRKFDAAGHEYSSVEIQQSLRRLELAFILGRRQERYFYRVPLFQKMLLAQDPKLMLRRELERCWLG